MRPLALLLLFAACASPPAPVTTPLVIEVRPPAPSGEASMTLTSEPGTRSVVVITPAPAPLTLSPPAPTWGPVPPATYVPPSDGRVRQTMRAHRRSAVGAFVVGGLGMAATLGFQTLRVQGLQRCAAQPSADADACTEQEALDFAFSRYGALGMAMFVAGTTGAGAMLGNAAATRDVQLLHGTVRPRSGLQVLGAVTLGASVAWMIGANVQLGRHEAQCEGDAGCLLRYRPLRLAANDGAALGVAAGAGMIGYAVAYERQGKALMRLRAAPSLGMRHAGVSVAMAF